MGTTAESALRRGDCFLAQQCSSRGGGEHAIDTDVPDVRRELLGEVEARLNDRFGCPEWRSSRPPMDELIATVLSQHTSDVNMARAFASLRSRYPDWPSVMAAPLNDVAETIHRGGLANIKAPRIQAILREVEAQTGGLTLAHLRSMDVSEAREWLMTLPGVSPKTASCVLLFSMGLPAMPVDTHVHRVSRRLGLVDERADPEMTQDALKATIGPDRAATYAMHMNLIRHGRETCRARNPRCGRCILAPNCPSARISR